MHHRWGSLSKEIKAALFKICKIPEIKSNAGSKIKEWKKSTHVMNAYSNLWEADDNGLILINKVIKKAMSKENEKGCLTSSIIAFTLAVCCIILNLHNDEIKCNE